METPKINYHEELKKFVNSLDFSQGKPKLFLHACCGPCETYPVTFLNNFFDITIGYFNPNIAPFEEWDLRLKELTRFINEFNKENGSNISIVTMPYDHQIYLDAIKGLENEPEGGKRCLVCHDLRIKLAYEYAYNNNFPYYTTVMTVSSHKPSSYLNNLGLRLQNDYPTTKFLVADFKKENGQLLGIQIAKKYNLYRQNYCGCIFAKKMQKELKAIKEKKLIIN